jgi:hypothetical protein
MSQLRFLPVLALTALVGCGSSETEIEPPTFAESISGHWASATCESAGPAGFLQKDFVISPTDYEIEVNVFGDDQCTIPLMTLDVSGPISVIGESSAVTGAYEVDYVMSTRTITPRAQMIVEGLNGAMCGDKGDWAIDQAGDVTKTGCPAFGIEPNPPCDKEMDLNKLDGDDLWFGDRSASLCTARPSKLGPLPVVRQK